MSKTPSFKLTNQLKIYDEYVEPIKRGEKTSTVRNGIRLINNPEIKFIPQTKAPFNVQLIGIDIVDFSDLTEKQAKADGFSSLKELKQTIKKIYKGIKDTSPMTIIKFKMPSK